jgi:ketosteroid isomerase-like protein
MARTPQDIFTHHVTALGGRDLDGIVADYTEASVLITAERSYRGRREIRAFFAALLDALPEAKWALTTTTYEGQVLYIEWTADATTHRVSDGVDTFVFDADSIAIQTAHCSLVKTALNAL